jgi:succinyl-CoA synthetase beta subunit
MSTTLSEAESKRLLAQHDVPFAAERVVDTADAAVEAAAEVGFPVAVKLSGDGIAHKTERGLVRLGLRDPDAVAHGAAELLAAAVPNDGPVALLVAPMISGNRELIAGLTRDPQFGMTVMVGIGGVLAEAVADVSIRLVPITDADAHDMISDLDTQTLLGAFRGEPAVDRERLAAVLRSLSDAAESNAEIESVDLNPLIIDNGVPIAVDALVVLSEDS